MIRFAVPRFTFDPGSVHSASLEVPGDKPDRPLFLNTTSSNIPEPGPKMDDSLLKGSPVSRKIIETRMNCYFGNDLIYFEIDGLLRMYDMCYGFFLGTLKFGLTQRQGSQPNLLLLTS